MSFLKLNSELEVLGSEHVHFEIRQAEAVPMLVQLLLLALLVLCHNQQIIEEKKSSLMRILFLLFVHICHLRDPAKTNKAAP